VRGFGRDLVIYAALHSAFVFSLAVLGEKRPDAYVSVSVLVYFVATSVLPSLRRSADLRVADIALAAVFLVVVALRVLSILGYAHFGGAP